MLAGRCGGVAPRRWWRVVWWCVWGSCGCVRARPVCGVPVVPVRWCWVGLGLAVVLWVRPRWARCSSAGVVCGCVCACGWLGVVPRAGGGFGARRGWLGGVRGVCWRRARGGCGVGGAVTRTLRPASASWQKELVMPRPLQSEAVLEGRQSNRALMRRLFAAKEQIHKIHPSRQRQTRRG